MKRGLVWQAQASQVLRRLMKKHSVTADELARRLTLLGLKTSGQAIRNKLPRGTFSAAFFLAAIAAMKTARVTLRSRELSNPKETGRVAVEVQAKEVAAALERAEADIRRQQRERLTELAKRPGLPEAEKRKLERLLRAMGKK